METPEILISQNGEQIGPLSREEAQERIAKGELSPNDYAWQDGCTDWVLLRDLIEPSCGTEVVLVQADTLDAYDEQSALLAFISDDQDPELVHKLLNRVKEIMTRDEVVDYIAVQKKPIVNFSPDAIVLTNRRLLIFRPKFMGMTFEDYLWREVADIHMSEQLLGATVTCTTMSGTRSEISHLPKKQARRIYAYAQEVEQQAALARRQAELERLRASAGGVVIQNAPPVLQPAPAAQEPQAEDSVAVLTRLKKMLDAGLILNSEYETKKAAILARM